MKRRAQLLLLLGALLSVPTPLASAQTPASRSGAEALHSAVRAGRVGEVQTLLNSGVNVNARDPLGSTPLHDAAWAGDVQMVQLLIAHGADVNARHLEAGSTALHYAILTGRVAVVQ